MPSDNSDIYNWVEPPAKYTAPPVTPERQYLQDKRRRKRDEEDRMSAAVRKSMLEKGQLPVEESLTPYLPEAHHILSVLQSTPLNLRARHLALLLKQRDSREKLRI